MRVETFLNATGDIDINKLKNFDKAKSFKNKKNKIVKTDSCKALYEIFN